MSCPAIWAAVIVFVVLSYNGVRTTVVPTYDVLVSPRGRLERLRRLELKTLCPSQRRKDLGWCMQEVEMLWTLTGGW